MMNASRLHACYLLLLLWGGLSTQLAQAQHGYRQFSTSQGLKSPDVQAILEDDLGYLWVGTNNGLFKFDGADFSPVVIREGLTLDNTEITCLMQDRNKNLWIGTSEHGLFAINTHTGRRTAFYHDSRIGVSLPDNRITCMFEDKVGNLWFGVHRKGICRLDPFTRAFISYRPSLHYPSLEARDCDVVLSSCLDATNPAKFWLGTLQGVFEVDIRDGSMHHFSLDAGNHAGIEAPSGLQSLVRSLKMPNDSTLALGTWGGGLCLLNPLTGVWRSYLFQTPDPVSQVRNSVPVLEWKSPYELWVGLGREENGIGIMDIRTTQIHIEPGPQSPRCIHTDRAGNVWMGSNQGLFLKPRQSNPFHFIPLPQSPLRIFPHPDGCRVFVTLARQNRMLVVDPENPKGKAYAYKPILDKGPGLNFIHNIHFLAGGGIVVVENTDIYYFDPARDTLLPLMRIDVPKVRENQWGFLDSQLDKAGNLWLGNKYAGLFFVDLAKRRIRQFTHNRNDPNSLVHTAWVKDLMCDSDGNIWFGTEEGFGFLRPDTNFVNFPYHSHRAGQPQLQLKSISKIAQDSSGRIWVGSSQKGVAYLSALTPTSAHLHGLTTDDGLRDDMVRGIACTPDGDTWLLTRNGISRINGKRLEIENFGHEFGLEGLRDIAAAPSSEVFLAAQDGFFRFWPDSVRPHRNSPKVLISTIQVDGVDYQGPLATQSLGRIQLSHDQDFLAIEYTALDFHAAALLEYSYRMKGVHENWVLAGNRKSCNYTGLSPGRQEFMVRARTEGGEWGIPTVLLIEVAYPYWQRWWFILLVTASAGLLAFFVARWRISLYRAQKAAQDEFREKLQEVEKKALQAQMNPHFLFNCLNSIKLLILKAEKEKAAAYLTKFSKLIRMVLQHSDLPSISLEDELQALGLYVDLECLRLNGKFDYLLTVDEGVGIREIVYPPLVLQPMVENAIWHGLMPKEGQGRLNVHVAASDGHLTVLIEDNGIGRAAAAQRARGNHKGKSFGIAVTRERLRLGTSFPGSGTHGAGHLEIIDLLDPTGLPAGTQVRITTPLVAKR